MPSSAMNGLKPTVFILAAAGWLGCTLLTFALKWHPDETYLDMDEVYWIGSTYYHDLAFTQRNWAHPDWQLLPARENPPVAKYVLGAGLAVAGQRVTTVDLLGYFYGKWARDVPALNTADRLQVVAAATPDVLEQFRASGRIPVTKPMVGAARTTVMVCAATASLLLFFLGTAAGHWVAGLIASQLLLLHPGMVESYNHAMADAIAVMFTCAAALVLFQWFAGQGASSPPARRRTLLLVLTGGLFLGLASGAKMNSLVLVGLTALLVAGLTSQAWWQGQRARAIRLGLEGLGLLVVGLAVFVVINPAIWQDPFGGLAATMTEHRQTALVQAQFLGGHLVTPGDKLAAVARLGAFGWVPFLLLGAVVATTAARHWRDPGVRFAVCWWLAALIGVTVWIPFAWPRYALPLLAPTTLLLGGALTRALPRRWPTRLNFPA